jgi:outer membrane autotransporter protein
VGADYSLGGTLFGINRWFGDHAMAGIYSGYGQSHVRTAGPDQSASVDSFQFGGYLRHLARNGYWLATGGFVYDDYDSTRFFSFGGIDRVARGDYSGQQGIAAVERGFSKQWNGYEMTPFATLQYIYLHQNDFTETGAGALNLAVAEANTHSLRSLVGIDVKRSFKKSNGPCIDGRFHALWMHEFLDTDGTLLARFSTAGSPAFGARGLDLGRDWAMLGYGIDIHRQGNATLFCNYDVQLNDNQTFHVGSGGLQFRW